MSECLTLETQALHKLISSGLTAYCPIGHTFAYFRPLWPCIMNAGWGEGNQQDKTNLVFIVKRLSQHVSGIIMPIFRRIRLCTTAYKPYAVVQRHVLLKMGLMMPETCWDRRLTIKIRFVACCWFLSLHHIFGYFCFEASMLAPARLVCVRATTFSRFSQSLQVRVGLKIIGGRVNDRIYEWRISMWIDEWINSRTYELVTPKNGECWTDLSST